MELAPNQRRYRASRVIIGNQFYSAHMNPLTVSIRCIIIGMASNLRAIVGLLYYTSVETKSICILLAQPIN